MKITNIQSTPKINYNQPQVQTSKKPELIDKLLDKVKNPSDINDSVSVPRGIFKAYMCLMSGTALGSIAGLMPKKAGVFKSALGIMSSLLGILSAAYFAKPFLINKPTQQTQQKSS